MYLKSKLSYTNQKKKKKEKKEVGDDFNICVLNLLPEVSTLPSLLAISLAKVEMFFFFFLQFFT